jgi:hypothetical protein
MTHELPKWHNPVRSRVLPIFRNRLWLISLRPMFPAENSARSLLFMACGRTTCQNAGLI